MKYNNEWLVKQYEDGSSKFLFFWGHQLSHDGSITKACFSQWWVAPFEIEGQVYNTAEHWMMAGKARLFNDAITLAKILAAGSAPQAKQLGREVQGFEPALWEKEKFNLVLQGNLHKFSSHPALKEFLLKTGNLVIAEASPMDTIWGIGLAADDPDAANPLKWKGENLLGYALMEVRDLLNNQS
jgi:ribA/ribD-fused uncharacterized protein